jgi:hypothetical protein
MSFFDWLFDRPLRKPGPEGDPEGARSNYGEGDPEGRRGNYGEGDPEGARGNYGEGNPEGDPEYY